MQSEQMMVLADVVAWHQEGPLGLVAGHVEEAGHAADHLEYLGASLLVVADLVVVVSRGV